MKNFTPVIIIPTAEVRRDNPWHLNQRGQTRVRAAYSLWRQNQRRAKVVICGGYPNHRGITLAEITAAYLTAEPEVTAMRESLVVVDGSHNNTVQDVMAATSLLCAALATTPSSLSVTFVSHPAHAARVLPVLTALGYGSIHFQPSGESGVVYGLKDTFMGWVSRHDPYWRGAFGRVFRALAWLRARQYRRHAMVWARQHQVQDATQSRWLSEQRHIWQTKGVRAPRVSQLG